MPFEMGQEREATAIHEGMSRMTPRADKIGAGSLSPVSPASPEASSIILDPLVLGSLNLRRGVHAPEAVGYCAWLCQSREDQI
jgi:hypothetical protein